MHDRIIISKIKLTGLYLQGNDIKIIPVNIVEFNSFCEVQIASKVLLDICIMTILLFYNYQVATQNQPLF